MVVVVALMPLMAAVLGFVGLDGFVPVLVLELLFLGFLVLLVFRPVGMMIADPIGAMIGPPVAIMPFVTLVEIAFIAPFGMIFGPFGMMAVEPAAIVIVPPVSLVPIVIVAIGAPSVVVRHLSPDVRMGLHELLQSGMLFPPRPVVNQVGISIELLLQLGTFIDKVVEALFVVVLGRRNRR